jgi:phage-related protein
MAIELFQAARVEQMQFQVEFYDTEDGRTPTQEFLDSLEPKMNAKMVGLMEILEEKGYSLREPYSAPLEDGIFELRAVQGSNISRALFFFYVEGRIVITHGFIKKTQKTPRAQIELAKKYRADFLRRQQAAVTSKKGSR